MSTARVLVTRPTHQAAALMQAIKAAGMQPNLVPCIEIHPPADEDAYLTALQANIDWADWLFFVSRNAVNGVEFGLEELGEIFPPHVKVAAIGEATSRALQSAGIEVSATPPSGVDSEALLSHPDLQEIAGKKVVIFRGQQGRKTLAEGLQQRGADLREQAVYRRVKPDEGGASLAIFLTADPSVPRVVTATSVAVLENLLALTPPAFVPTLLQLPLVVISERIARVATQLGFQQVEVADVANAQAMTPAIVAVVQRSR